MRKTSRTLTLGLILFALLGTLFSTAPTASAASKRLGHWRCESTDQNSEGKVKDVDLDLRERHEQLSESVDVAPLDEIEEVLEDNAEAFVRGFVCAREIGYYNNLGILYERQVDMAEGRVNSSHNMHFTASGPEDTTLRRSGSFTSEWQRMHTYVFADFPLNAPFAWLWAFDENNNVAYYAEADHKLDFELPNRI
ncbi:ubiquitin-like protein Pup [Streptomyces shenzhenensis]|uniref:ubiquitin-like protein Pup n=1 Tax=Streptomyces shenzhenensis TaxID=943815 RepID=UPI003F53F352